MSGGDETVDVAVVGARVAGAALGTLLARRGLRVAVLDQAAAPRFTLSSNIIQADALAFLHRLGVLERLRAAGAGTMSHVDMRLEDFRCRVPFPQRPGDRGGAACLRREVLDPVLAQEAAASGARVRLGAKAVGLLEEDGRVTGVRVAHGGSEHRLRARLVVGADGRASSVAAWCGARRYHVLPGRRSYYWTYFEGADPGPEPTFVFHRWGDQHLLGGPADNGLYIVGVSPRREERDAFHRDLEGGVRAHARSCEPIAAALAGARRATRIFGIRRFHGYFREAAGPGWVLLGDSGHFKDPAGGRGIGDAFHQAERLAPAVAAALEGSDAEVDRATAAFGRWRDRHYAEYYGLAADLGMDGPIAAVVPRVVARLHARGRTDEVLDLLSHRASVLRVLSPARVLAATGGLLARPAPPGRRLTALTGLGALAATEVRRRRAMARPVHSTGQPPHPTDPVQPEPAQPEPVQPDSSEAELSR
ncbi:NAD(P)/FAD-dependent oxidoreductase [Streptomyces sp. 891-h]|uniref:NAD(P)/FAD-dependent oxidoreductase n=1 Tax=Streptomyces sp. 891-h TaxID=2720714 RepID=UPI001FA9B955|nr:NAD(P)/FAD-dependent oxidoreductase [Streptomyces sp. 891-h]UNZ19548.1 NAD(P)/FAD-dependent oxidoreductase [Streptomyces sp. 891-h]